jgi:hypothetical protein
VAPEPFDDDVEPPEPLVTPPPPPPPLEEELVVVVAKRGSKVSQSRAQAAKLAATASTRSETRVIHWSA